MDNLQRFVLETSITMMSSSRGWGNGYVFIPKEHPLHGVDYNEVYNMYPDLEVHGGLTFSDYAKFFESLGDDISANPND